MSTVSSKIYMIFLKISIEVNIFNLCKRERTFLGGGITRLIGVPRSGASNSNMISRIPVRIRTKKAVTKTGSQKSQRIQLTQNRVTRTRIRFRTANHPLKENCERQERWRERTCSLKDGFSTHESLSPPSLMLGLHLSLFIMELIKPFCFI